MTALLNEFLSSSSAWGVLLTLAAFALGTLINKVTGKAVFNPLLLGLVKLEDVKEVGLFLTGIFPLLFVPAAAGVMELWVEMGDMLLPIVIAIVPVTVLVLVTAGHTTQALTRRKQTKKEAAANDSAAE